MPEPSAVIAGGAWVDLSHPLDADAPRVPFFPAPRFTRILSMPEKPMNVTEMSMVAHIGTHLDAPRHFFLDGPAFEDIPLERLSGPGVIWPVAVGDGELIEPAHLEGARRLLKPGDILIVNTGYHLLSGTGRYDDDHPSVSVRAAEWILEHDVKLLGVDTPTPELAVRRRTEGFDHPVHRRLLAHGVLIAEHVTNLAPLSGHRVEIVCNALNITGSDGAPARIMARMLQ